MKKAYRSSYWTPEMKLKNFFSQACSEKEHYQHLKDAIANGDIDDYKTLSWTHVIQ